MAQTPGMISRFSPARRRTLGALAALGAAGALRAAPAEQLRKAIPATGERLPAVGMGTWLTFDVRAGAEREARLPVLRAFFAAGGLVLDSSPMYGYAEEALGELVPRASPAAMFSATKVWTPLRALGVRQMEESFARWGVKRFDLMQVHNLLDWEAHLATLKAWKAAGRIRYLGLTTSHGRRHDELEAAMRRERLDFVQFTYSFADREAEKRLLPASADRGAAVIVNRPFDGGSLFGAVKGKPLPGWAAELDCANWAQVFLKFVVSHPAVTCAIPATTSAAHMAENMGALAGRQPDAALRRRMAADLDRLL